MQKFEKAPESRRMYFAHTSSAQRTWVFLSTEANMSSYHLEAHSVRCVGNANRGPCDSTLSEPLVCIRFELRCIYVPIGAEDHFFLHSFYQCPLLLGVSSCLFTSRHNNGKSITSTLLPRKIKSQGFIQLRAFLLAPAILEWELPLRDPVVHQLHSYPQYPTLQHLHPHHLLQLHRP